MRGLEFEYKQNGNPLIGIFEGVSLKEYSIYIDEAEIINNNNFKEIPEKINGNEFKKVMFDSNYCILFANIQAYPNNSCKSEITTYDDFIKSNCELIILVIDSHYIEIYGKNEKTIKKIKENAIKNGCLNIEIKTNENDGRTRLKLW